MNELICDFRFAICHLLGSRCRETRGGHNCSQFGRFLMQGRNLLCLQQAVIDNQLHPVGGFICFFLNGSEFRYKLGFRTAAAGCPVIGSHRHSTADQLATNSSAFNGSRQSTNQFEHPQGKMLCSLLQFSFVHKCEARNSQGKSQIANRKSKIPMSDLKLSLRQFLKHPGVTLVAAVAICLGANLALFAVIDSVLVRNLPFPTPDQLMTMFNTCAKAGVDQSSSPLADFRREVPLSTNVSSFPLEIPVPQESSNAAWPASSLGPQLQRQIANRKSKI